MDTKGKLIRAVRSATKKLAGSQNLDAVLNDVLTICVNAVGADGGTIYLHESATKRLRFQHVFPHSVQSKLPMQDIPDDFGMAGAAFQSNETIIKVLPERPESELNDFEKATGVIVRSIITTPLVMEDEQPIGVVQLLNKDHGCFTESDADVLETIASVATMAFHNFRLTEEASRASALLGMGKVSHDIGNLAASLHANLSFAEFSAQTIESNLPEKRAPEVDAALGQLMPQFESIRETLDRMVGYSHLIADLSAGRELRPKLRNNDLGETVSLAASYLEPMARAEEVDLQYDIEPGVEYLFDEGYVFRIVQNLVTNALKAVNENEDVSSKKTVVVRFKKIKGEPTIEIIDSGPGMTARNIERVLSGNARSQWGNASGSGLGAKIVLELSATHCAKLEIDSELGKGTTFRVRFPRVEEATRSHRPAKAG